MATYKIRGLSHNVIFSYLTETGERKQHWESYETELEAIQRKAYIDVLQKGKRYDDIRKAALEYKKKRAIEASSVKMAHAALPGQPTAPSLQEDNTCRTFREFMEKFLPFHARKERFSPNTYDSYISNLENHIYPYFGDRVMSTITAEDIDCFLDYLTQKPCKGSKSYGKRADETPHLSSGTIKKVYNILMVGFPTAKKWRYITEIPDTTPPAEKYKKRTAWEPEKIFETLDGMKDNPLLHLAVHMAFVCSFRAGEVAGIDISTIDFRDRSLWVTQIVQRVSDEAIKTIPKEEIIAVFPKQVATAKSSLILKDPKTEGSKRKQYLTTPLLQEIKERLTVIEGNKAFFGKSYHNYGLLFCQPDGRPVDPKWFNSAFKEWQQSIGIDRPIELQGLRKSGQMHKVRLTQNNYQLVAESGGQSPQVLMSNYNEALDSEKRTLSLLVETSFYPGYASPTITDFSSVQALDLLMKKVQQDPTLYQQLLQLMVADAAKAK